MASFRGDDQSFLAQRGYTVDFLIHHGSLGQIFEVTERNSTQRFAVKCIHFNTAESQFFGSEPKIAKHLLKSPSQNLISFFDIFTSPAQNEVPNYYIVEELGISSLDRYIKVRKKEKLSDEEAKHLIKGVANGAYFMHMKLKIAHMNIEPSNIILCQTSNDSWDPKLADFSLAVFKKREDPEGVISCDSVRGSEAYSAPEMYLPSYKQFDCVKADIFSLGVVLLIIVGCPIQPFTPQKLVHKPVSVHLKKTADAQKEEDELFLKLVNISLTLKCTQNYIPTLCRQMKISTTISKLIVGMLAPHPNKRINWSEFFNSTFIRANQIFSLNL